MGPIDYTVVLRGFTNAASDDFSPGGVIAFISNPTNVAWTKYVNEVGEAFFTVSQADPIMPRLQSISSTLSLRPFVSFLRNGIVVWSGWLGEIDETETDVIFYAYSYLSGFHDLIMDYTRKWTGVNVSTIVSDSLAYGQAKTKNRVHWITSGTVENPWTDDSKTVGLQMALYKAPYKRILSVWKELATYAISDTTNHVIFEITPAGVFNFLKDRKSTIAHSLGTVFGAGNVRSYRRIRRPVERRNNLFAVGTSPTTVNLNTQKTNVALRTAMGLSEEPIYLSFVKDATELSRVASSRLARATREDTDLYISFHRNTVIPADATLAQYALGDLITVDIDNGITNFAEQKIIMGQQVTFSRMSENVRIILADKL